MGVVGSEVYLNNECAAFPDGWDGTARTQQHQTHKVERVTVCREREMAPESKVFERDTHPQWKGVT